MSFVFNLGQKAGENFGKNPATLAGFSVAQKSGEYAQSIFQNTDVNFKDWATETSLVARIYNLFNKNQD